MRIRTYTGVSIDGFMGATDGMPVWNLVPGFVPGEAYGMREFLAQIEAVVVGRTTFDFGHMVWTQHGTWPWEGKRVYVLTSRPLPEQAHADVVASDGGPAGLVEQLRAADLAGDAQLLGGARTFRAFLKLGAIDELGLCVLPLLLGDGVPLFAPGEASQTPQRLVSHRSFADGAIELFYVAA